MIKKALESELGIQSLVDEKYGKKIQVQLSECGSRCCEIIIRVLGSVRAYNNDCYNCI